jgi:hypothetical protein
MENNLSPEYFIPNEKLQAALEEMKSQGFELGKVYSNPYATAFKPQKIEESPVIKKLRESEN